MASGDTKTEAMLNVLGNGGTGDEFRGCCNTKTQGYILDAIDRINSLTPGGGPTVVQTTGTSTTDVMSQKAVTDTLFKDNNTAKIQIGNGANNVGSGVAIGNSATIGSLSYRAVALGSEANANATGSVAIGAYSSATSQGEFNIGTTQTANGYNNTNYRLLTGVHDPVNAHDAATKGYVDARAGGVTLYINTDIENVIANGSANIHIYSDSSLTDEIDNEQFGAYVAAGESINFKYYDDLFKVIHIYDSSGVGFVSFIGGASSKLTHEIDIYFDGSMTGIKTFSAEAMEYQFV